MELARLLCNLLLVPLQKDVAERPDIFLAALSRHDPDGGCCCHVWKICRYLYWHRLFLVCGRHFVVAADVCKRPLLQTLQEEDFRNPLVYTCCATTARRAFWTGR